MEDMVSSLMTLVFVVAIMLGIFLAIRTIMLWYWKVNTILENQQKQIVLLAEIIDAIRRTQPTRVEPKASEKQTTG